MADTENTLILETTQGPVTIEMRPDLAPGHVARIKELVREGFYDGIVFHRVIEGFMAQTGCPQGTGTGGSGKKLKAEFNKEPHVRGTTSMARAANPDSGDSQFFICFDDASFLNNQYTVWGKVTSGMENVDKIKRAGAGSGQDHQGPHGRRRGLKPKIVIRGLDPRIHQSSEESFVEDGLPDQPAMTAWPCAPIFSTSNFPPAA
jgi:peptidylprolyl isomerase